MKITYVPLNPDATGFYRCLSPGRQLALHGHEVRMPFKETRDTKNDRWLWELNVDNLLKRVDQPDLYCLQMRWERHWISEGIHSLREKGAAIVVECDDNYLEQPEWNPAFYGNHPYRRDDGTIRNRKMRRSQAQKKFVEGQVGHKVKMSVAANQTSKINRTHGFQMMNQADAVVVSTPHLADIYSAYNENIHVVRNYLDWEMWKDCTPQYKMVRERTRLGWLGAVRYRRGDLDAIRNVIPKVMKRHPEIDFVANTEAVHDMLGVPIEQRITIGEWEFYQGMGGSTPLAEMTAVMDIGLVPLSLGGFNEGKSHLKGMEYNAAGIPYIASNTESYRYYTGEKNGVIAYNEKDWETYIEELLRDDAYRREMGRAGRETAKEHTIQGNWMRWENTFGNVVGGTYEELSRGAIKRGAVQKVSELAALLKLAATKELKTVVEVGSARGGTFWALSQIAADDALLVSIDIPAGSPLDVRNGQDVYTGRDRDRFKEFVKDGQRLKLIDGNSQSEDTLNKLIDTIGVSKIDMLLIDADHRYEGVKRDYELYSPLVREGGIIAFHDVIRQNDLRSGVHLLWNELEEQARWTPLGKTHKWVGNDNWGLGSWGGIGAIEVRRAHARV